MFEFLKEVLKTVRAVVGLPKQAKGPKWTPIPPPPPKKPE